MFRILFAAALLFSANSRGSEIEEHSTDLLIVGATESGWAAAIQAARLGVKKITIVHDGVWFGGQFTEQALVCVDENKGMDKVGWGVDWHPMRRSFHRSGLFKELMDRIEAFNMEKYGSPMPGKPWHGPSTFRPAEAEAIFREMIQPYMDSGQIRVIWNKYPWGAKIAEIEDEPESRSFKLGESPNDDPIKRQQLTVVGFSSVGEEEIDLWVESKITIDATDWGEVIQVSGTAFECGPDPQSRYDEVSAPKAGTYPKNEMNPITWAMIVAESESETPIAKPPRFDDRNYPRATHFSRAKFGKLEWDVKNPGMGSILHWPPAGEASKRQLSVYSVRRIVDGFSSKDGKTSILLNYMNGQDYALERLPQPVVDALEKTEAGAGGKNIVEMSRAQRKIVFQDAKNHSLGVLYHLQNFVHESADDRAHTFRNFHLSNEFGTEDSLPPKPYIREGLRLKAMYMMREQDARNRDGETKTAAKPRFAAVTYPDGLFAWQFHYDFHRTGRTYLKDEGANGPWIDYFKKNRHTKFLSDRSTFPLRSLVPEKMDGLLGAQGNVGFSSIVSAAIRLHDQRIHIGQAAGATAAICLREGVQPREIPYDRMMLETVRHALCGEIEEASPLLLWGFRDLPADHDAFVSVNRLAALGLLKMDSLDVDFHPDDPATAQWATSFGRKLLTVPETRGEFCERWWKEEFGDETDFSEFEFVRKNPTDADDDGILDSNDALLFTPNEPIVFSISKPKLTPDTDGIPPKDAGRLVNFGTPASGAPFDEKAGHGWERDLSKNNRKRNAMDGPRDSFIFTREKDTWSCRLDVKGDYRVTLCVGDSNHEQKNQAVRINGKAVVSDESTLGGAFIEKTVTLKNIDLLLIEIGSGKSGSNTCLNWVHIAPAD